MLMSWIWTGMGLLALAASLVTGKGADLAASVPQGAKAGVDLSLTLAGSLCLWSGVGRLMESAGLTRLLSRILSPLLNRLFPSARRDPELSGALSANVCANFLGLGNAATPMGIRAACRLAENAPAGTATDELCRLIVLNTASIQFIPATVAAVRAGLGSAAPFDILPAVWISSLCSAGMGLLAAGLFGRLRRK